MRVFVPGVGKPGLVEVARNGRGLEIGRRISFGPARLEVYPYGL
ncbi:MULTISPECIES: hypothetical protein [Streptomyces]|nr:hypothetical protein [Streptomyces sp. XY511]